MTKGCPCELCKDTGYVIFSDETIKEFCPCQTGKLLKEKEMKCEICNDTGLVEYDSMSVHCTCKAGINLKEKEMSCSQCMDKGYYTLYGVFHICECKAGVDLQKKDACCTLEGRGEEMEVKCSKCNDVGTIEHIGGTTLYCSCSIGAEIKARVMVLDKLQDSGERTEFSTGAVRDMHEGKGRYDLITPIGLRRLAQHYENGAKKYNDRNWEKGIPLNSCLDSAIRHLFAILEGKEDEDHPAAVVWNMMAYMHIKELIEKGELPKELAE